MIRIIKPEPPDILRTTGRTKRANLCRQYSRHAAEYDAGQRTFTFDATVYAHPDVKQVLVAAQHGKCCFCERKIGHDGDVEHFRPKAGCRQSAEEPLLRPGYYWLAYEWNNLLLSCGPCNQRFKRNLFPLANPNRRARAHSDDTADEEPLFVNPAQIDPEQHIEFRRGVAYPVNGSVAGRETLDALHLNRANLVEVRLKYRGILLAFREILDSEEELKTTPKGRRNLQYARDFLKQAVANSEEFAAMARAERRRDFRREENEP